MIGLSCTADAVLALCGQVRGTLERKGLPKRSWTAAGCGSNPGTTRAPASALSR